MKHAEASAATRAKLIEQFSELYSQLPLEKVTVKEISSKAGVSRVTFYNYYSDPYELLDELEDGFIASFMGNAIGLFQDGFTPDGFSETFTRAYRENKSLTKLLFLGSHSDVFAVKIKDAIIELITPWITGLTIDSRLRYSFEYHISGMVSLFKSWLKAEDIGVDEIASLVQDLMLKGVLATLTANGQSQ